MSDWTSGYVAEIGYGFGYYQELSPLRARFALASVGIACPEFATACELGFGQGLSANLHAAAMPIGWYGTDFNPSHASFARTLAAESGSAALFSDEAFEEFCARADLPDFDFIGLHGTWSWISDHNRRVIVDFLRRKLKVGGVLYISYNTMPGKAPAVPLRHLLTEHAARMTKAGARLPAKIDAAMNFAGKVIELGAKYTALYPTEVARFRDMLAHDHSYLAHEYFNRDWAPMHFSELADWLEPAKLTYCCRSRLLDHMDGLYLTDAQRAFLAEIPDLRFRETVRDFMTAEEFRRDYWVKGAQPLAAADRQAALGALSVVLVIRRADVPNNLKTEVQQAELQEQIYGPVLAALEDNRARRISELTAEVAGAGVSLAQTVHALTVLIGMGAVAIAQDPTVIAQAKPRTDRLNAYLMRRARSHAGVKYLASPVVGGGIEVDRIEQLFLLARSEGLPVERWPSFVSDLVAAQGQALRKDGKELGPEEMRQTLAEMPAGFVERRLPLLSALMIA